MIIRTMKSCSKPPSMRPISRLTDCQVSWLWTEETAVKITPLPLTLCSLQGVSFVAVWPRLLGFFCVCFCALTIFALCEFSTLSAFPDSRVRNMLCDRIHKIHRIRCGWTAHGSTVLRCRVRVGYCSLELRLQYTGIPYLPVWIRFRILKCSLQQ